MVLSRQVINYENGDTVSVSTMTQEVQCDNSENSPTVSTLCCPGSADIFFTGKDDGSVSVYDTNTGNVLEDLFRLSVNAMIIFLQFEPSSNIIITVDSSSRVTAPKIQ